MRGTRIRADKESRRAERRDDRIECVECGELIFERRDICVATRGYGTGAVGADEVHERVKLRPALLRRHEVARIQGTLSRFTHPLLEKRLFFWSGPRCFVKMRKLEFLKTGEFANA
jgi:hypothetical protein